MTSDTILSVRQLCKQYGSFFAVNHLDLEVRRGDVYGFLGPNGAGKSTTIRMMLSLIRPTSGTIRIFGNEIKASRRNSLSRIGCIVEKPDFYKYLSARKNLEIAASLSGSRISKSRIPEVIDLVGLTGREKDPVKNYSHGMKQRLGLAQALLHDPELILLDEPGTGLDPQGIIDIRNLIVYLQREQGKTILLSSHILSEIEQIASRMVIINNGKAVVEGEVSQLLNPDELIVSFSFQEAEKADHAIRNSSWNKHRAIRYENRIEFQLAAAQVPQLNAWLCEQGIGVTAIESRRKLEDYFLKLVNSGPAREEGGKKPWMKLKKER